MSIKDFFRFRSIWMGFAILGVMFLHSKLVITFFPLAIIREMGYGGVDIFAFASGVGAYCSYTSDYCIYSFLKRRVRRLAPIYLPFIVLWLLFKQIFEQYPRSTIIGNLLGIEGFTASNYSFSWYLSFLFIIYLLTPVFVDIIDQNQETKKEIIFIIALVVFSVPFWNTEALIIFSRLPIFVLGLYFAQFKNEHDMITMKMISVLLIALAGGVIILFLVFLKYSWTLWDYGMYWYPFILITPGLCLAISYFCKILSDSPCRIVITVLEYCGKRSFELFLVHIFFMDIYDFLLARKYFNESNTGRLLTYGFVLLAAEILNRIANKIRVWLS